MDINNTTPNTLIVDENALKSSQKKNWFSVGMVVKVIIVLIIIGLSVELYLGYKSLNEPSLVVKDQQESVIKNAEPVGGSAILSLVSQEGEVKTGDIISAALRVSTFGKTIKDVVAVIKYDPKIVEIPEEGFFTKGDGYSVNPLVTNSSLNGTIRISGQSGSPTTGFTGVGTLGILKFKAKKPGTTQISIGEGSQILDYFEGKNILGKTYNLDLDIK